MRISDWSSDVCSSDPNAPAANRSIVGLRLEKQVGWRAAVLASLQPRKSSTAPMSESQVAATDSALRMQAGAWVCCTLPWLPVDTVRTAPSGRKSGGWVTRLSVRVGLGGGRIRNKTNKIKT